MNYQPHQVSVDEPMITYKGRLSFIQYMPKKPHKWGPKAWVLADTTNGYCWDWKLYTGGEGNTTEHGLAHRVVMDLVKHRRLTEKGIDARDVKPLCAHTLAWKDIVH